MIYNSNLLVSKYDFANLELFQLRDLYLDFFDTEFGGAINEMEVSVYVRFDPADRPYKIESNEWLETKKLSRPRVRFLRSRQKLVVEYITKVPGAEGEFPLPGEIREEFLSINAQSFSAFCEEFLDALINHLPAALKECKNFEYVRFVEHLESKKTNLPVTESALKQLIKRRAEFNYEKIRKWHSVKSDSTGRKRPPKSIPIQRTETHTPYMGKFHSGQFWGQIADESNTHQTGEDTKDSKYVYSILHIFDKEGKHQKTVWEKTKVSSDLGADEIAESRLTELLAPYSPYKFESVNLQLFKTVVDDVICGLLNRSDEENAKVEMCPDGYVLFAPWNGHFDT